MDGKRRSRTSLVTRGALLAIVLVLAYAALAVVAHYELHARLRALQAAAGLEVSFDEPLPEPPAERNAAVVYQQAFDAMRRSGADADIARTPIGGQREFLRGVVDRNAEALSLIHRANGMADCVVPSGLSWKADRIVDKRSQYLLQLLAASRLLWSTAVYRGLARDSEGAVGVCLDHVDMAEGLAPEHGMIVVSQREFLLSGATADIERVLCETPLSAQQCRALADRLARVELDAASAREYCRDEVTDTLRAAQVIPEPEEQGSPVSASPRNGGLASRCVGWLGQPWREWLAQRRLSGVRTSLREATRPWREVKPLADERERKGQHEEEYLVALFRDRCLARLGLAQVALGLHAWKATHGVWPDSIAQLRDEAHWPLRQDPFSGQDFIYKPRADTFLLYSVGKKLTDDGGKFAMNDPDGEAGDIVWGRRAEIQAAANTEAERRAASTPKR